MDIVEVSPALCCMQGLSLIDYAGRGQLTGHGNIHFRIKSDPLADVSKAEHLDVGASEVQPSQCNQIGKLVFDCQLYERSLRVRLTLKAASCLILRLLVKSKCTNVFLKTTR